ncbi:MAG: hypothetical protein QOI33_3996 [Mycobacterium sp.]|jgi:hypothetical protein|nr:hypothetical protein [Mycobacterium sp.]
MPQILRPGITAGIALAGASLIAVTPAAVPGPDVQHRSVQLVDVDHGVIPFPEVDYNDMVANTTANWNGLMDMFDHTTAIYSLPDAVYTQGLTQVFNDLSTEVQELAKYSAALSVYDAAVAAQHGALDPTGPLPPIPTFPDLYNDPVLNPVSALTLLIQNSLSSGFGANAAEVGWTGIYQNMLPSINDINTQFGGISTQFENLLSGGTFSMSAINTDFTNIGTDLTTVEKFLSLAPTTLLNDYLNGYPVESSAADPIAGVVPSIGDAYTLNAPFNAGDNVSITPEFGLLSNPFAAFTTDTSGFGDGPSSTFLGSSPLETGTLAALLQTEQTLSDELLTVTSTVPGSGVTAPDPTGILTILGPDTLTFQLDLAQIPVIGDVITFINTTVTPALNGALTTVIETTNTLIGTVNDGVDALSTLLTNTVNPFIDLANVFADLIGESISPVTVDIPTIPTIPLSDIPSIPSIPTLVGDTFNLPGITEPGVPAYVMDLAHNEMAILGSIAGIAAPVTGTVSSADIGNFLAENPIMNLGTIFDSTLASIFAGTPLTFTSTLPLDWTNLVAESLQSLFTAS